MSVQQGGTQLYVNTGTLASPVFVAVGTVNDGIQRLAVSATGTLATAPLQNANATNRYMSKFLNGTASSMIVSATTANPQVFKVSANAAGGKLITVTKVRLVMTAASLPLTGGVFADAQAGLFGGVTALPNGFVMDIISGGTTYTLYTFKINEDFIFACSNVATTDESNGTQDMIVADFDMVQPLVAGSTDAIRFSVKDNFTAANLNYMQAMAYGIQS